MSAAFTHLSTPLRIGAIELKNRMFFPGHGTGLPDNNVPGDRHIAYLTARARGGAALIVTEIAQVEERAIYSAQALRIVGDHQIPAYQQLADAIHAEGSHVVVQLFHAGREMHVQPDGRRPVAWAPSELPTDANHVMPRPMSVDNIRAVIREFAQAAQRLQQAGIDGVEIVATHGFLPSQFLNPEANHRTDDYGGSASNRLRFLQELLSAVRSATSRAFVIGLRICADEGHAGGLTEDVAKSACIALDQGNAVDYFSLTLGTVAAHGAAVDMIAPMGGDHARIEQRSGAFRTALSKPVLIAGRIHQMTHAESIVARGDADMVGMARAQVCDPEIVSKAFDLRSDDIRACIGCNQACIGHRHSGAPISCIQNPVTGRELTLGKLSRANPPRRVLVAGGGPAGMKAAAIAATRGHHVTLYEQSTKLGGQARLAERLPGRSEFGGLISNLEREMANAGVHIVMDQQVDHALISEHTPDVVIVSTGGAPFRPTVEGQEDGHVVDAWAVLNGEANVGSKVIIADWASDWTGLGLAEMLARNGCGVRLVVNGRMAGEQLHAYLRDHWAGKLHTLGVQVIPYAKLFGVGEDAVYFQHIANGEAMVMENVDTLVTVSGQVGVRDLEQTLCDFAGEVHVIGDCQAARTAEEAILEGYEVGATI